MLIAQQINLKYISIFDAENIFHVYDNVSKIRDLFTLKTEAVNTNLPSIYQRNSTTAGQTRIHYTMDTKKLRSCSGVCYKIYSSGKVAYAKQFE